MSPDGAPAVASSHPHDSGNQLSFNAIAGSALLRAIYVIAALAIFILALELLKAGAGGLMAARVESAAHAEEFMQWVKFAPRGNRGMNASGYDCLYGGKTLPQLAADANRDNFVAIQIETPGALEE